MDVKIAVEVVVGVFAFRDAVIVAAVHHLARLEELEARPAIERAIPLLAALPRAAKVLKRAA
jgi:hypothetical protein